ncbi:hypothetical protein QTL86_02745 [Cellulosilyticum sp. ST5]|uniref:hypothetical protein n=1 Tax=Cellulosilyticum sp. ST5 TaxID=3055805 RepID=UPI003977845D
MTEEEKKILEQAEAIRKKEASKSKQKKKGSFMKGIIVGVFLFLLVFIGVVLWLFYKTGSEPSTLIASVFAVAVGEFSILGSIKKTKG